MGFPSGEIRFVADITVGKAAKWLRILGFDACFMRRLDEGFLAARLAEGRILITRDSRLAVRRGMTNALLLTADDPAAQVADILRRLGLVEAVREAVGRLEAETHGPPAAGPRLPLSGAGAGWPRPLSRCIRCNEPLAEVSRAEAAPEVPDFTWATQGRFQRCPVCRRVYWPGTHRERILAALAALGPGCGSR
ncbi:MAG: Mut7-C RNAse domain-containing protein [Candidatus Tectomicrobia bacterium]|nr:Mut7-C RNAse domain-containing protein [Candidatus Tectomicrobia bacterium]